MTLMRMPVFTWMSFVTQILLVFAMPVISIALFLLTFDRLFDANFFNVSAGADPLLWEHLFWIFGHPEVYILILPAFGIVSEIIPVFSRKPIFGYPFMVFSGIAIGFMGWGVWAHHMFASGLGPWSVAAFSVSTMFIAVPTGVKILNWMATMWGGKLTFTTPMLFAVGLVAMFTIGGLSGVTHAVAPADTQQTDTYYIVAHFHYVIFGGALFGFLGGFYFWWPKAFGWILDDKRGKWHFWLTLIGFNLTFGPMHILGLQGMSRRIQTYRDGYGFDFWNARRHHRCVPDRPERRVLLLQHLASRRRRRPTCRRPGPTRGTLAASSGASRRPPRPTTSTTTRSSPSSTTGGTRSTARTSRVASWPSPTAEEVAMPGDPSRSHLPAPSYWPIVLSLAFPLIGYGLIFNMTLAGIGGAVLLAGMVGWALEPPDDEDLPPHGHDDHDDHDGGDDDDAAERRGPPTPTPSASPILRPPPSPRR